MVELLVTVVIISVLACLVFPMAGLAVKRSKEQDLRQNLRTIREAIDAYKLATDEGKIIREITESGYPHSLEELAAGVPNAKSSPSEKIYFLRRIPRDPFFSDKTVPAEQTWGKRSYVSSAEEPKEGKDIYDVFSLSTENGLNGTPYREW